MRLLKRIRRSFPAKLSFYVLLATIPIFLITFFISYFFSSRIIRENAEERAVGLLNNTRQQIENVFTAVRTAPKNILWAVIEKGVEPDSLYSLTREMILHNEYVFGSAVAFEPGYFRSKGHYFSPYSYRDGDSIHTIQLGNDNYDYHSMEWYKVPKEQDAPHWTEPYFDEGGGEMLMVTYSSPIHDPRGKFVGIFTVDVSLGWLTDLVNSVRPYESAYTILLGKGGTYIVHPKKENILNRSIFSVAAELGDKDLGLVGERMTAGETGMVELKRTSFSDNKRSYIFFTPLLSKDWSLGTVIHKEEVFAKLGFMNKAVISVIVIGLLLLFIVCMWIVRSLTRPLSAFSESARKIAKGDFEVELPEIRSEDEMGELRNSFHYMQEHLTDYIDKLKETTSTKERIESELRIARDIQMGMIPKIFPPFPDRDDVDLYAVLVPAKEVGGDLYDFFIDSGRLYFLIGDVSGKGVPASLFMAVTRSLFRSIALYYTDPAQIVSSMNNSMSETNESNMFVTLFVGILDLGSGRLSYCNAGHNPPVVIGPDGRAGMMAVEANIPAGIFPDAPYKSEAYDMRRGTTLFLYTDGLTEAENTGKALYGEARLISMLERAAGKEPYETTVMVTEDVKEHVGPAEQSDDLTILVIKY